MQDKWEDGTNVVTCIWNSYISPAVDDDLWCYIWDSVNKDELKTPIIVDMELHQYG